MFDPTLAVTGSSTVGTSFAVAVTGGIGGTKGKGGLGTGGNTGRTGLTTGGNGGTTGTTGRTAGSIGGTGGSIGGGTKNLSPYAIDSAELIVLPKRLNELVVEIVPVPTVFARKLDHRIRFCNCLTPNLNRNLPSLEVADRSVGDFRMRRPTISLGDSSYEITYLGSVCTSNVMGLVETCLSGISGISNLPVTQ
jgi:hypothetical protein